MGKREREREGGKERERMNKEEEESPKRALGDWGDVKGVPMPSFCQRNLANRAAARLLNKTKSTTVDGVHSNLLHALFAGTEAGHDIWAGSLSE
jgi:hypothetical protein